MSQQISEEICKVADKLKPTIEQKLNLKFKKYEVLDFERFPADTQHTSYYIKVGTDNNGHVRFRATETEDKGDWCCEIEEYDRGNVPLDPNLYSRGTEKSNVEKKGVQSGGISTGMSNQPSNPWLMLLNRYLREMVR